MKIPNFLSQGTIDLARTTTWQVNDVDRRPMLAREGGEGDDA